MSLLAAPSSWVQGIFFAVFGVVAIWGTSSIILAILKKPQTNAKYGLIAALVVSVPTAYGGIIGSRGPTDRIFAVIAVSLIVVTIYLLGGDQTGPRTPNVRPGNDEI
jgi:uncharacterized membrane protein YfcA